MFVPVLLFFEFSLCLSRACLGKKITFIYKWRKKPCVPSPHLIKPHLCHVMPCSRGTGDGQINLDEFQIWWRENGGDLEKQKHLALTVQLRGGDDLLLVAPDRPSKERWVDGLRALLRIQGRQLLHEHDVGNRTTGLIPSP
jgi:hypothetical protein